MVFGKWVGNVRDGITENYGREELVGGERVGVVVEWVRGRLDGGIG